MKSLVLLSFLFLSLPAFAAHSVSLTWTQSTDPVALNCVFRASATGAEDPKNPLFCSTAPITSYTDQAVAAGDTWFYTTDAVSAKGVASPFSNEATAVVPLLPTSNLQAQGH
jgi:fibronectin type 3 domain-containing protein